MKICAKKDKWQSLLVKPIAIGLLAGFVSLFTSSAAYAVCVTGGPGIIHLGGRNMIVYWDERDCNSIQSVIKYRTSSNLGQTWSAENTLVSSVNVGFIEQFEDIFIVGKRGKLAAVYIVFEGGNPLFPRFELVTSSDFGRTWGSEIVAWDITSTIPSYVGFFGCPELSGESTPGSGLLSLITTIVDGGGVSAWIVTSRNSGQTWDTPIELAYLPLVCDGD